MFDIKNGQLMHVFQAPTGSATAVQGLSFSENGTWLASANQGQSAVSIWDLRKMNLLKALEVGTPISGISWDYTGQYLAACGSGGVVVNQYAKSSKSWTELLRKGVGSVDVKWGAKAKSLVALTGEGAVSVLTA